MADRWTFDTPWGRFAIVQMGTRFHAVFEGDSLGAYASPGLALDDLVGGYTVWPSNGLDPATAGLPDDLSEWTHREI